MLKHTMMKKQVQFITTFFCSLVLIAGSFENQLNAQSTTSWEQHEGAGLQIFGSTMLIHGDTGKTGEAGRQRVLKDFNWDQNLVRLESLLGDLDSPVNPDHDISDTLSADTAQEAAL